MNFVKRAYLSVINKKVKNFILLVAFFIIAALILACLSIQTAVKESGAQARKSLGSSITLKSADRKTADRTIPVDVAEKLRRLEYVKSYNYIINDLGHALNFSPIGIKNYNPKADRLEANIYLNGVANSELSADFSDKSSKLVEGRHLTNEDAGKPYCLIEKNLARSNNIKIGDKITLGSAYDVNKSVLLEVIGIYQTSENGDAFGGTALLPFNKIYINHTQVHSVSNKTGIEFANFYLDDPINIDSFKKAAVDLKLGVPDKYILDAQDTLYRKMTGHIQILASLARIMVISITAAGCIILGLIIVLSLKSRRHEIGILLSIGESKIKAAAQLVFETLIPVCLAFVIAAASGSFISQQISNTVLSSQIQSSKNEVNKYNNKNIPANYLQKDTTKEISKINVNISFIGLLGLFAILMIIVVGASVIPIISILRYNPKTILIQIE